MLLTLVSFCASQTSPFSPSSTSTPSAWFSIEERINQLRERFVPEVFDAITVLDSSELEEKEKNADRLMEMCEKSLLQQDSKIENYKEENELLAKGIEQKKASIVKLSEEIVADKNTICGNNENVLHSDQEKGKIQKWKEEKMFPSLGKCEVLHAFLLY